MSWGEIKKVNDDLSIPLNRGGVKVVKSIQRGVCTANSTVTFDEVDLDKTMIILNSSIAGHTNYADYAIAGYGYISDITPTSMTVIPGGISGSPLAYGNKVGYQIIEFY